LLGGAASKYAVNKKHNDYNQQDGKQAAGIVPLAGTVRPGRDGRKEQGYKMISIKPSIFSLLRNRFRGNGVAHVADGWHIGAQSVTLAAPHSVWFQAVFSLAVAAVAAREVWLLLAPPVQPRNRHSPLSVW
jgi:hypothetical protein